MFHLFDFVVCRLVRDRARGPRHRRSHRPRFTYLSHYRVPRTRSNELIESRASVTCSDVSKDGSRLNEEHKRKPRWRWKLPSCSNSKERVRSTTNRGASDNVHSVPVMSGRA
ncbi:unnamed protein product [Nesidiocoris tenuis]|uniref:Uncharacterized protein n=1 Tax=Nesidiocoris tenuis TaxID=355587 RepID=A0A6H5HE18_9HEMI|nr:unnamed protein product [Nesidiocoris tenuis]